MIYVYNAKTGLHEKTLYIPSKTVEGEIEGIFIDTNATMYLVYNRRGYAYNDIYTTNCLKNEGSYKVNYYTQSASNTKKYVLNSSETKQSKYGEPILVKNISKAIEGYKFSEAFLSGSTTKPTSGAITECLALQNGKRTINLYYDCNNNLKDATVTLKSSSYQYMGSPITQAITVKHNNKTLVENTDYTVTYKNNINVGTATITITGKGNYVGSIQKTFEIVRRKINVPVIEDKVYNGQEYSLSNGTGYTISGSVKGTDVATKTITVVPTSNYMWSDGTTTSKKITWKIIPKPITVKAINQSVTKGSSINTNVNQVTVTGLVSGHTLSSISLTANTSSVGTTAITPSKAVIKNGSTAVTSNYSITYTNGTVTVKENAKSIGDATIELADTSLVYTGKALTPNVTVKYGTTTLVKDTDYEITYGQNTDAGTANVVVTGKGQYVNSKTITWKIVPKPITIKANNQAINQGEKISTDLSQVTISGLVGGHTLSSITISTDKKDNTVIVPSNAIIKNGSTTVTLNYSITYKSGTLTIGEQSVPEEPAIDEPTIDEPIIDEPTSNEPITDKPIIDEPIIDEPTVDNQTTDDPSFEAVNDNPSAEEARDVWSNASDWAIKELRKASKKELIPDMIKNKDFTMTINRKEFAAIAVKMYEKLSKKVATAAKQNPFIDINDEEVLKAYKLGITLGTSEDTFSPNDNITREQMATMLTRAVKKAGKNTAVDVERTQKFEDDNLISDWGRESIYYMADKGIILGMGDNIFGVLDNATREQALLISVRCLVWAN